MIRCTCAATLVLVAAFGLLAPQLQAQDQPATSSPSASRIDLNQGERIVLLGSSFIERMQAQNHLETWLTARFPKRNLTFRNIGWSGDTVQGIARAVFGSPEEGFARLLKDLREAEPTLILVCYGNNEAHAGAAGLESFEQQLQTLLDQITAICPRVALITPRPYAKAGPQMPDPAPYNASLALYSQKIRETAAARNLPLLDLHAYAVKQDSDAVESAPDGVQLTNFGYWTVSMQLAELLGCGPSPWQLDFHAGDGQYDAVNVSVQAVESDANRIRWVLLDRYLPPPACPGTLEADKQRAIFGGLRVRGLAEGTYQLLIDGVPIMEASGAEWAAGCVLPLRGGHEQVESLRSVVDEKNQLYFHRYRPQNETYLFLFRKHEQGNNAVEIPQFDPLIAECEQRIAALAVPEKHTYELVRTQ